jgi:hypothetical protein
VPSIDFPPMYPSITIITIDLIVIAIVVVVLVVVSSVSSSQPRTREYSSVLSLPVHVDHQLLSLLSCVSTVSTRSSSPNALSPPPYPPRCTASIVGKLLSLCADLWSYWLWQEYAHACAVPSVRDVRRLHHH